MEPDIIPLHSVSPPPLDDDGGGEAGSEDDEFGDFGGFSVGESTNSLSSFRQLSYTTIKPATHQSTCSCNRPVEQSQPTSTVDLASDRGQMYVEGQDCNAESSVHLTNGFSERNHSSQIPIASAVGACSPKEETGFADFTLFTEQAAHPWCCGFSPMDSKEQWDARGGVGKKYTNSSGEHRNDSGQDDVMDSEPGSSCACNTKQENVCTKVKHCEKRDAVTSQDHDQPQEAADTLDFQSEEPISRKECGDSQRERGNSLNPLQTTEVQEEGESDGEGRGNSISTVPQTFSVHESASEDLTSFCDDLSIEGPSLDLEPNVSSLVSQDDQTDWDQTDDDEEEDALGNDRQSEEEKGFHFCDQSATQETSATSEHSQSETHAGDSFADFKEYTVEQGHIQTDEGAEVLSLGNLPPSDSFADFCSAPTQEDGEDSWAEFKEQRVQEDGKTWTQFKEPVSSLQADGDTEEEPDRAGRCGVSRRNSCQASLTCRVQQLLVTNFPEVEVPAVESEEEVLSLDALLHAQYLPESEEEEEKEEEEPAIRPKSQWIHQDLHDAVGLKFQWGGSYTNRTLLRCLGVETRNIVFIGMKKQPVAVPAFASGLGMLEPTKDSVPVVCSPRHTVVSTTKTTAPKPPASPDHSTYSTQEALPSRQLDWSSRGLSSSQDGTSPRRAPHFWGWK
ncbi:hypothetical protein PBY51_015362 [Eleginops maclovinus]|uniref:Aftiphilin clathrin-binding box domain-containing protein n=1 Tax=Eleginops maclovinus TaxID=56733 RepID=A0AAN8AGM0_ELEMC|nr:hypothetical protein PBY51_015362 [Eleginops maclovinus]